MATTTPTDAELDALEKRLRELACLSGHGELGDAAAALAALSVFSKWERGTYMPNLRRLMDWAEALGLEIRIIEREEKDR